MSEIPASVAGGLFNEVQHEPSRKVGRAGIKKPIVFKNNRFFCIYGGEAGIRTLGGDQPSTVFKTAAFGRSATSPYLLHYIEKYIYYNSYILL